MVWQLFIYQGFINLINIEQIVAVIVLHNAVDT